MGNSASVPQVDTTAPLPDDLFDLSDLQLKVLWDSAPLSLHEIQQAAKHSSDVGSPPQKPRRSSRSGGETNNGAEEEEEEKELVYLSGLYYTPGGNDEESPEFELAVRLSQLLTELALLRFRLVPNRLKEDQFWMVTLMLLKERLVEYNESRYKENKQLFKQVKPQMNGNHTYTKTNASQRENGGDDLQRQVQIQKVQINKLKRQIRELEEQLAAATAAAATSHKPAPTTTKASTRTTTTTTTTKSNNTKKQAPSHKGSWKMDADSQEFLQYPDEVKESLRAEKQRRLQQVYNEMKFILDSDEVHHTHGKWECCGEPTYHASCSM